MSVKLDWHISESESELEPEPAEPQPTHNWRRLWLALAAVALTTVAVIVTVRAMTEEGQHRLEAAVREAVTQELRAITADDRELFLSLQDPTDRSWVAAQGSTFDSFRQFSIVPREVLSIQVEGDRAWADVQLTATSGREVQVTWEYRRMGQEWRHARLDESWWGPRQAIQSGTVTVLYSARDEDAARDVLSRVLNAIHWTCTDFGCDSVPSIAVDITHSVSLPPAVDWLASGVLAFPSPHSGGGGPGGLPPASLVDELARQISRKVIYSRAGLPLPQPADARLQATLAEQAADWEASKRGLVTATAPSNYIAALAAEQGPTAVRKVIAALGKTDSIEGALTSALDLSLSALERSPDYFIFLLNAEAEAIRRHDRNTFEKLQDPFSTGWLRLQAGRYDRSEVRLAVGGEIVGRILRRSTRDRFIVMRTRLTSGQETIERLESFRWANGRWLHTGPVFEVWGATVSDQTALFYVTYRQLDAEFVRPLVSGLDRLYQRIDRDLGGTDISISVPLAISIEPLAQELTELPDLVVPSPWVMGVPVSDDRASGVRPLRRQIVTAMTQSLAREQAHGELTPPQEAALTALVEWEVRRVLGEPLLDAEAQDGLKRALASDHLLPLDVLWTTPVMVRPSFGQPEILGWPLARAEWLTLIDYAFGGKGANPLLAPLTLLPASTSMDDWLRRSLGIGLADVEPGWRVKLADY